MVKAKIYILSVLWIAVLISSFGSAYDLHTKNVSLEYSFTSNNATQCNLTTGNTPSGLVTINQIATKNGNTFNITIAKGNFLRVGDYCFNIICTDGNEIESGSVCRTINDSGQFGGIDPLTVILALIGFGIFTSMVTYRFNKFLGNLSFVLLGTGVFFYFISQGVDVFGFGGLIIAVVMSVKMIWDLVKF